MFIIIPCSLLANQWNWLIIDIEPKDMGHDKMTNLKRNPGT